MDTQCYNLDKRVFPISHLWYDFLDSSSSSSSILYNRSQLRKSIDSRKYNVSYCTSLIEMYIR